MTRKTLNFLHRSYVTVVESEDTHHIIDILQGLHNKLSEYKVPDDDTEEFYEFLRNIERSISIRQKTFQLTNLISDIVFTMMYIVIWANMTYNLDLDINITARRKSLESELTKLLEKSIIRDRFGIRGIVLNKDSEDDHIEIEKLEKFSKYVLNILTKRNLKHYSQFQNWVQESDFIDTYTKERLFYILKIPFQFGYVKDYINDPKPNGYQSFHFVLMIEMYSDVLPGADFEVQLRTNQMHQNAVNGDAKHTTYKKKSIDEDLQKVFTIDDFSKVNIFGFTSYNSSDDDIDGIHHYKPLFNRRVSNSLVTSYV